MVDTGNDRLLRFSGGEVDDELVVGGHGLRGHRAMPLVLDHQHRSAEDLYESLLWLHHRLKSGSGSLLRLLLKWLMLAWTEGLNPPSLHEWWHLAYDRSVER